MLESSEHYCVSEGNDTCSLENERIMRGDLNFFGESNVLDEEMENKLESKNFYKELRYDLVRIERNINIEVKKRIEANRNIQQLIEHTANDMINNVLNKITTRIENISFDLDKIIKKCDELEQMIGQIRVNLPTKIQTEMISLKREVSDFFIILSKYANNKKKRNNILFAKIENMNAYIGTKIQSEVSFKDQDFIFFKTESDKIILYDSDNENSFKNVFLHQVQEIKDALDLTIKAREQSDDDIIQAMNKYTSILQKALHSVITSNH
ncbi:SF-assemblin/beta giardin domain containing protein [Plasmodium gonderi]|uniref:SF-assemblin/beta giardin domain containing protein n=1 Tax=Plasmodium gonderi TaxID=77519 RepID=A0A1Y1JNV4_PLAGO|nr:SF-assemblin/beta giardin domain containing protein [Plasmodium gonderi]GAW82907.1 SF-assemblin/beta giardin domain containing protein [Plasmodium gonderi]